MKSDRRQGREERAHHRKLTRERSTIMYKRILVPIDGSDTSLCALNEAAKLARLCHARIDLLHIVEPMTGGFEPPEVYLRDILPRFIQQGEKLLKDKAETLRAQGVSVDPVLIEGGTERVSDEIIEQARVRGDEIIVLGTHGRRGVSRMMMGSDAEQVARISPVPVMLIRPQKTENSDATKAA
jgi:nucleotide-binding universal stress UspA family protein